MEQSYIFVGELAKKTGVTVRTLQYYDRVGLLKPTLSEGGRRMYSRDDILKLQQILFLKSLGFSLEEIGDKLLSTASSAELKNVFVRQQEILQDQIGRLRRIAEMLDTVIPELETGRDISMEKLMTMMDLMKQGNPYSFVIRYFEEDQFQRIAHRFESPEKYKGIMLQSQSVFSELDRLYQEGADPAGKEGQELAAQWWKMVTDFTSGDPNLLKPLLCAGGDIQNWPKETAGFQEAIQNFLSVALDIYLKSNGISLEKEH